MSTALSHLPENWPNAGSALPDSLRVSESPSFSEMLEEIWVQAILEAQYEEVEIARVCGDADGQRV